MLETMGNTMLLFKNMIFNKHTLIYVKSQKIRIHLNGHKEIELSKNTLFIIGKKSKIVGINGNISVNEVYSICDEDVELIAKFLSYIDVHPDNNSAPLIIGPSLNIEEELAFKQLKNETSSFRRVSILLFLFSRINTNELSKFFKQSIPVVLISEKVSSILERNLTQQWSIREMAFALHTSESSLRRRLKEENYTFSQLTLDTKMKNALLLLENNTGNIGFVAQCLGYTSEAYFISVFKKYFDITPKQFYLRNKRPYETLFISK